MNAEFAAFNYEYSASGDDVTSIPINHGMNTRAPQVSFYANGNSASFSTEVVDENNIVVSFYLDTDSTIDIGVLGAPVSALTLSAPAPAPVTGITGSTGATGS